MYSLDFRVENNDWTLYKKASHHSLRQPKQSPCCLAFAPQVSFSQSRKSSSSFFSTRNCPRTTYALSNPFSSSLLPRTSPMPARAITFFSPMGSATKSLCFWDVDDMAAWQAVTDHQLLLSSCRRCISP